MTQLRQGRNERCNCGSGKKYKYCHGSINYREGVTSEPDQTKTETEMKLEDAEVQLRLAMEHTGDERVVRSCINSFISTARSVTMVMERESNDNKSLISWYKYKTDGFKTSADASIWEYFAENRTYTIHKGVIAPARMTAQITDFRKNDIPQSISPDATMTFLRFANPPAGNPNDSGGIYRLCTAYLQLLSGLVAEWLAQRSELKLQSGKPHLEENELRGQS
jgi:hypothetical protein